MNQSTSENSKSINPYPSSGKNMDTAKENGQQKEGAVAKAIETQTSKLPSDTFLWAAVGAIVISAGLQATKYKNTSNFVGQWAPTFLILGLYNKIVKLLGSESK